MVAIGNFSGKDLGLLALLSGAGILSANRPGVGGGSAIGQGLLGGLGAFSGLQQQQQSRQLQQLKIQQAQASLAQAQKQQALLASLLAPGGTAGGQLPPGGQSPGGQLPGGTLPARSGPSLAPGGPVTAGPPLPTPLMAGLPATAPQPPQTAPQGGSNALPAAAAPARPQGLPARFSNPNLPFQLAAAGLPQVGNMIASQQQRQASAAAAAQKQGATATKQTFDFENTLRKQFLDESAPFIGIRDAFSRVQSAMADPSAAGDLALIFNYMKILDPGSTVREGEFATAERSAGVPARIRNIYNKVITGQRLSDEQRGDFVNQAGNLFKSQKRQQDKLAKQFTGLSERNKLNPENVVLDITGEFLPEAAVGTTTPPPQAGVPTQAAGQAAPQPAPAIGSTVSTEAAVPDGTTGELEDGTRVIRRGGQWVPIEEPPALRAAPTAVPSIGGIPLPLGQQRGR